MAPRVSLDDQSAWDDSALINSWDEAVAEYQKYHSISKSGKRLEHALTTEELQKLRGDYGDVMDEDTRPGAGLDNGTDASHAVLPEKQPNGEGPSEPNRVQAKDGTPPADQGSAKAHDGPMTASMPQALLESVQDKNLKNLMMSWYYAGYYTGLVAGQGNGSPQNQQ